MTNPENMAFPNPSSDSVGFTKREWFAGIICAGLAANPLVLEASAVAMKDGGDVAKNISECAIQQADALISALNKTK